jgi:STE24 endopeptidase
VSGRAAGDLARRPALLILVVAVAVLAGLAAVFVPWSWVPGGHLVPVPARELFNPHQIARMERYSSVQRRLGWASTAVSLVVLLVLGLTPLGARAVHRWAPRRWWLAVPLSALAVLVVELVATLGFAIASHATDLRYGISREGWAAWSSDEAKQLMVSWVATSILLLVALGCARRSPRWWFAWAGTAALVLTVLGSFLYPVLVEPLFDRFTPMPPGPFKTSVFRLADRVGVHIDDVLVADASRRTTTLNAYVSGFGSTRRVVVYDTTLRDLTPDETRVVIAHELGHAEHDDVLLGTALGSVGVLAGVSLLALVLDSPVVRRRAAVAGPGDPGAVAVILALVAVATFLASPVENTVSRAIEARADRVSIQATHQDATFVQMQRQLALRSLADPTPPTWSQLWWGSHPTVLQRAGLPRSMRAAAR